MHYHEQLLASQRENRTDHRISAELKRTTAALKASEDSRRRTDFVERVSAAEKTTKGMWDFLRRETRGGARAAAPTPPLLSGKTIAVTDEQKAEAFADFYDRHPLAVDRGAEQDLDREFDREIGGGKIVVTEDQMWRALRCQRETGAGPDGVTGLQMRLLLRTCTGFEEMRIFT